MSSVAPSRASVSSNLFLKILLLLVFVSASAFGLVLLFRERSNLPTWLENWSAVVMLALISGFGSRWILNRRSGFLRFVAAMFTYLVGLFLLGLFSEWKYGIGPFEIWPKQVDVDGLIQVAVGLVIFFLVSRAWRKRPTLSSQAVAAPRPAPAARPRPAAIPKRARPSAVKPTKRKSVLEFLKPKAKPVSVKRAGRVAKPKKTVKPIRAEELPVRQKKSILRRGQPKVQLAIVEEHRCPFCLEPVSRVDPRGVVECEVCHTLHHKDCWEITGVCQVPHYNS